MPVPRVYAHSSDPFNPVGAEYIIEEKARGVPLTSVWDKWGTGSQLFFVAQLGEFEKKLKSILFRGHGCIYYKKDLKKKDIRVQDLETSPKLLPDGTVMQYDSNLISQYALGPLTKASLWEGERATMDLDRGPCKLFAPI